MFGTRRARFCLFVALFFTNIALSLKKWNKWSWLVVSACCSVCLVLIWNVKCLTQSQAGSSSFLVADTQIYTYICMFDEHNAKTLIFVQEHMGSTLLFLAQWPSKQSTCWILLWQQWWLYIPGSFSSRWWPSNDLARVGRRFRGELQVDLPQWPSSLWRDAQRGSFL